MILCAVCRKPAVILFDGAALICQACEYGPPDLRRVEGFGLCLFDARESGWPNFPGQLALALPAPQPASAFYE
jgi:hypothetical protein